MRVDRKNRDLILYYQHLDRLKNMRSKIDNTEPKTHPFSNKFTIEKSIKKNRIEMENKIICDRILQSGKKSSIDNKLSPSVICYQKFKEQIFLHKHKLIIDKINMENRKLLQRLINVEPVYKF
jgi:hypothetical protein